LEKNFGKINFKKLALFALMILFLTGCGRNNDDDYYRGQNYNRDHYYGDVYYELIDELNRLSIRNIDDIEEMVFIAWDFDANVEVEYVDNYGYHLEMGYIENDYMLGIFLDEIYYNEVHVLDAEVLENEYYELFLIFTVEE